MSSRPVTSRLGVQAGTCLAAWLAAVAGGDPLCGGCVRADRPHLRGAPVRCQHRPLARCSWPSRASCAARCSAPSRALRWGLLIDLALLQTLGVTSLTFTLIGYWSGRLRELRDPQAALTPLLVGAAAAASAMVGYSLIEFLLGVDAPVSFELLREIVRRGAARHGRGAADVGARAPLPDRRTARGSPPSPPPRLHDRRAQPAVAILRARPMSSRGPSAQALPATAATAGETVSTIERLKPNEPRARLAPAGTAGRGPRQLSRWCMFAIIFFRLWYLQILTGEQYVQQAKVNDQRVLPIPAPRGEIRRPRRQTDRRRARDQRGADHPELAARGRARTGGRIPGSAGTRPRAEYVAARAQLKSYRRASLNTSPHDARREAVELHSVAPGGGAHFETWRSRRCRRRRPGCAVCSTVLAPVIRLSPRSIDERVIAAITQLPYAPATIKTDAGRAAYTVLGERHNEFPGVRQRTRVDPPLPLRGNGRTGARPRRGSR